MTVMEKSRSFKVMKIMVFLKSNISRYGSGIKFSLNNLYFEHFGYTGL
jgi:hypothetical protein